MKNIASFIKKWQRKLGLSNWKIGFELVDQFERTDNYPQTGDIKVDTKNKSATILLLQTAKDKEKIIVHEIVHLLLWEWDHQVEKLCKDQQERDEHLEILETTVAKLTKMLLSKL